MPGRGEKGILIATGTFSSNAKKEASRDGAPPVERCEPCTNSAFVCPLLVIEPKWARCYDVEANRRTNLSAVSATSRQPESMTNE